MSRLGREKAKGCGRAATLSRVSWVVLSLFGLSACGGATPAGTPLSPSPVPAASVTSVVVTGETTLVAISQTTQLRAVAALSNATTQDVTAQATWTSSNPGVATVSSSGLVTVMGFGGVEIRASHAGSSGGIGLSVAPPASGSLLRYDVAPDVPPADLSAIVSGITKAQAFLAAEYGGDIPVDVQVRTTVKVVATGVGNQESGGSGACCTALDSAGVRPFFDVRHPSWNVPNWGGEWSLTANKEKIAVHEWVHGWQYVLGGLSFTSRERLVGWLSEGMAEYIAFETIVRTGAIRAGDVDTYALRTAVSSGEARRCLGALESISEAGVWPGNVGLIAVKRLIALSPHGRLSLRVINQNLGNRMTFDQAFLDAFSITKQDFYAAFPAHLASIGGPTSCT
ncbi:MAG: Ig-like domain-containing protein [Acidobacteriota bacterium]|nr:Ig-like domain-containing protein [Acidobacteriota bacterium]